MIGKYGLDEVDMLNSPPEHQDSIDLVPKIASQAMDLALMLDPRSTEKRLAFKLERNSIRIIWVEELGG